MLHDVICIARQKKITSNRMDSAQIYPNYLQFDFQIHYCGLLSD